MMNNKKNMSKFDNNGDGVMSSLERRKVLKGTAKIIYTVPILTMLSTSLKADRYADGSQGWTSYDIPPDPPTS